MEQTDRPALTDIPAALGLLSRLPVRVDTARGARAAWAYPLAGLALALIAGTIAELALWSGIPAVLTAGLTLATLIIATGAMHEDGLADTADGFWGGWDKARRLAILKDSHTGVYGVIALVIGLGVRWQALGLLIAYDALWPALFATAVLSRASMVALMASLPNARTDGLSRAVGRPSRTTALIALIIAGCVTLLCFQTFSLWLFALAGFATLACGLIARSKIGGQTGDVLGATQQIVEIIMLLALAAHFT